MCACNTPSHPASPSSRAPAASKLLLTLNRSTSVGVHDRQRPYVLTPTPEATPEGQHMRVGSRDEAQLCLHQLPANCTCRAHAPVCMHAAAPTPLRSVRPSPQRHVHQCRCKLALCAPKPSATRPSMSMQSCSLCAQALRYVSINVALALSYVSINVDATSLSVRPSPQLCVHQCRCNLALCAP